MASSKKKASKAKAKRAGKREAPSVDEVLRTLERMSSKKVREGMARYGIPSDDALGIPVGALRQLAKKLGPSHELAVALWDSGIYEARLLTAFVGEPERVTRAQMDQWCRDFDDWAVCDTLCFALFDRSPHAFSRVVAWSKKQDEFAKRGAFALLASLALHDKRASNAAFVECLPLVERAATDPRNFVKKGVSWALRAIGGRTAELNLAARKLALRLAAASDPTARWIGKDALRDLTRPALQKKLAAR
jgi:3-methyladenine DNA glycosylase AlkD